MGIAGANISRQEMHGVAHRFSHPAASPGQVVADIIPVPVPTSKICMMIDDRLGDRGFLESALDEENRIQTVPFQLVTEHGGYGIPRRGLCRGRGWAMHPTLVRRPHLQVHTAPGTRSRRQLRGSRRVPRSSCLAVAAVSARPRNPSRSLSNAGNSLALRVPVATSCSVFVGTLLLAR